MSAKSSKSGYFSLMVNIHWSISFTLGVFAYLFAIHYGPQLHSTNFIFQAFFNILPSIAPIIALVIMFPAPFSWLKARKKAKRLDAQHSKYSLQQLDWYEFEELVGEAYRRQGYMVIENDNRGADGGIDLRLLKDGELTLVQCKHWKSNRVGVSIVREMFGVLIDQNAKEMIIVCSGDFTEEAESFAANKPMQLISGKTLLDMIGNVRKTPVPKNITTCPQCQSQLVERIAKKGPNKGERFMGCSQFPKCRYTRW
jgi:restriction system protein